MFYNLAKFVVTIVLVVLRRWQVVGLENFPSQGGVVVISNHTSYWDPVAVGCALNRPIHYMAKAELFEIPLFNTLIRALRSFPVKRGKPDRNAIRQAIELLTNGEVLGIFPEGRRSSSGELLKPQLGAVMLAFKGNAPIVPVGIIGARGFFGKLTVVIGKPVPLPQYTGSKAGREDMERYSAQVMDQLKQLIKSRQ
ncbi:lysophospholipid acyltransferase family protein [Desulfofalx alkaliphila]|uniref:lysophospholipid acyltransferase family protein n=1 Tax=Desulfofalx alkaliphila TaxID=105483 RepID=UPI0004E0C2EB|nr:lysophospholipid acyltransferase family protein [Desulfofalx alkaliphila]